ncbi:family 2 encapsulin nanocompartment cargo protein terpene cyclase [Yinghuangia seranimata]|uniref:family 2 encapsulin nanocompartment cargo protein terpene cyclase n=1 Tax=Yinghuangia seranimata TaxID=408067 RepID=UPI00248AA9F4|nr:family 2 encapsulin nanocompartment cargo protein terpene cyclase [Yinghuangia seranimata]MDI2129684.1 family 2 encapsulin nanocompartment cargo protein terpene cyclase [Yinghuangia seranimata]
MSVLSRVSAPRAGHELADYVAALLAAPPSGPTSAPGGTRPGRTRLPGPTGLGTAAARIRPDREPSTATLTPPAPTPTPTPTAGHTTNGRRDRQGAPALYCPPALRDDPVLAEAVNERLIAWADEVGIYPGRLESVRAANFGRLVMLTHPESDDPDRLLAAAKCALAEWASDDHYCDDESAGADPALLGARLGVATAVVDPAQLPREYTPQFEQAVGADPVLKALRSALDHLGRYADPTQVNRLRHEISQLFGGYLAEGSWRTSGHRPPVWEYLAARQINSFLPCMTLVDVVGGYELPPAEYADPAVRRAVKLAATAATLVNDLYSMAREDAGPSVGYNLPALIAAEENCSLQAAVEKAARIHDELVHTFEAEAAALALTGSPALRRYLAGIWAWLGGNREWHRSTERYQ